MIEVFNMDCMDLLRNAKDKQWEYAIVDPPYGIGESKRTQSRPITAKQKNGTRLYVSSARKHKVSDWDKERPTKEYFDELRRVSCHQIIWGGNHFADLLPKSSGWIVWDKCNDGSDQSDCELAWTSFKQGTRIVRYLWNGFLQGRPDAPTTAQGNKKLNEVRIHPTQKPVYIYKWILHKYLPADDSREISILDTHFGSGSLGIAVDDDFNQQYKLTATEKDTDYYNAAMQRIHVNQQQQKLFYPYWA